MNVIRIPEVYILKRWTKNAKNGMTRVRNEGIAIVDEKTRKKQRYKELCNSFIQLAVKAAESEDSYDYTMECLSKMGKNIDEMVGKGNNATVEAKKVGDVAAEGNVDENQIKGLKPKGRVTYQTCKRPKKALEQAISRKRKPKATKSGLEHTSSTQESEGIALINDEYWNLTYTAFDPQNIS